MRILVTIESVYSTTSVNTNPNYHDTLFCTTLFNIYKLLNNWQI